VVVVVWNVVRLKIDCVAYTKAVGVPAGGNSRALSLYM